ncbi:MULTISPECIES: flagellar protein export ATPase FliI [unclassified Halanaerobium]|uniref:flagellar protein export ATPase FliI n=1 Tax=unclassified Halanaerobium TaxID=2641197 RepID=UPI000DF47C8F|nr:MULTISPECIES: flagellar protein export ATPase FliI [unclassified Halanaerobium]RCW47692.1 type III secretion system FliI/YscN family ATPase [Halanaerobium sp. MA284_MarDTE_T2]RCW84664.1 type III secretion system FliI/YscN family ATPase [Halanaerobium sp. DL-01]
MVNIDFENLGKRLNNINMTRNFGHINRVIGLVIESIGPEASIGELCLIETEEGNLKAEVVGFDDNKVLMMPIGEMDGIKPGAKVTATNERLKVHVGKNLLGKVLDGTGQVISQDNSNKAGLKEVNVNNRPPDPMKRSRIKEPLSLGIKCIDGLLTCGKGQRLGIFSGSGVGKSTLLGMAARNTNADINVIGLIGERGREVKDFLEKDLGEEGLKRSIVIAATSDQPALVRVKAANIATAVAEYFRNQGEDVLLMMDSVTRVAMALREVGLAIGEPPATRGYPPSVFAKLPKLLERTGTNDKGSITALYTVLVEGDDFNEPVSDTVRGILDGHISLSRELAEASHYPAVDVLSSVSRIMKDIVDEEHVKAADKFKKLLATYNQSKDLINIGAYEHGSNAEVDRAIDKIDSINNFLTQNINEKTNFEQTVEHLKNIAAE